MAEGMVRERLNLYYLLDASGSMAGDRIQQLNTVMPELKTELAEAAIENNVEIVIRVIQFGIKSQADWHEGKPAQGTKIENFIWTDLEADGGTPTTSAINKLITGLDPEYLGKRALRPVIILVTDGGCTENGYKEACQRLASAIKGNTTRIAIGVEGAEKSELIEFASEGVIGDVKKPLVFEVSDANMMKEVIRWASVVSIASSSKMSAGGNQSNAPELSPEGLDEIEDIWIE